MVAAWSVVYLLGRNYIKNWLKTFNLKTCRYLIPTVLSVVHSYKSRFLLHKEKVVMDITLMLTERGMAAHVY